MKTLILKTNGMSAYGLQTFDTNRKVNSFPTRSGILGLIAAALGITRAFYKELYELSENVTVAVQVNNPGTKILDYHTVQDFRSPASKIQYGSTKQTYREYWCDSEYTFAFSAHEEIIKKIENAVKIPKFTLFQGRKNCPLTRPLFETRLDIDNPVDAILSLKLKGHIYSDTHNGSYITSISARDKHSSLYRKYLMRTVYIIDYTKGAA